MKTIRIKPFTMNNISVSAIEIEITDGLNDTTTSISNKPAPSEVAPFISSLFGDTERKEEKPRKGRSYYTPRNDGAGTYQLSDINVWIKKYSKADAAKDVTTAVIKTELEHGNQAVFLDGSSKHNCTNTEGLKWLNQIYKFAKL